MLTAMETVPALGISRRVAYIMVLQYVVFKCVCLCLCACCCVLRMWFKVYMQIIHKCAHKCIHVFVSLCCMYV